MDKIKHVTAKCMDCGLRWCGKNARVYGKNHARKHNHYVTIETMILEQINKNDISIFDEKELFDKIKPETILKLIYH